MEETDHNMVVVEIMMMTPHQMMNLTTIITTMDTLIVVGTITITRKSTTTITSTMGTIKSGMRMIIDRKVENVSLTYNFLFL